MNQYIVHIVNFIIEELRKVREDVNKLLSAHKQNTELPSYGHKGNSY
jgi:hypothetical protein